MFLPRLVLQNPKFTQNLPPKTSAALPVKIDLLRSEQPLRVWDKLSTSYMHSFKPAQSLLRSPFNVNMGLNHPIVTSDRLHIHFLFHCFKRKNHNRAAETEQFTASPSAIEHYDDTHHDQRAAMAAFKKDHSVSKPLWDHTGICFHERAVFNRSNDHPVAKNWRKNNNAQTKVFLSAFSELINLRARQTISTVLRRSWVKTDSGMLNASTVQF